MRLAREFAVDAVHVSADVTPYAARRAARLRAALPCPLVQHDGGVTAVPPGRAGPKSGGPARVFTPYHRSWLAALGWRAVAEPPARVTIPAVLDPGDVSTDGATPAGETTARRAADAWLDGSLASYDVGEPPGHDDLAADSTSRLSAWLHFGALSSYELARTLDLDAPGAAAFARQLAWRDFFAQCLADRPDAAHADFRGRGDHWRDDPAALDAWRAGRTGIPLVDAGMRQLLAEGWMHNRARLVTASFLTKTLHADWRAGAAHFAAHLADADVANNVLNWQWAAGTGTDARPNRVLNPLRQAERYDPSGDYVRRYVEELAAVPGPAVHQPWRLARPPAGYPAPIVDLAQARARFLAGRNGSVARPETVA